MPNGGTKTTGVGTEFSPDDTDVANALLPSSDVGVTQTASPKSNEIWEQVLTSLSTQFDANEYRKWVNELRFLAEFRGEIIVAAKDQLGFFRIKGRIEKLIQRRWEALDPRKRHLKIMVWDSVPDEVKDVIDTPWPTEAAVTPQNRLASSSNSIAVTRKSHHKLDFETFIIGKANRNATGLAKRVAEHANIGGHIAYFHGRQGTGKTHILRAIENSIIESNSDLTVCYCSAEDFMTSYIEGAKAGDTRGLRSKVRGVNVFLIDDIHTLSGKKGTEQELLSTIKSVTLDGGKVAISADVPAQDLVGFSSRLISELKGATAVELQTPDHDLCRAILRQREALIHYSCPAFSLTEEMVDKILTSVRGTGRDIIGILGSIYTETGFGDVPTSLSIVDDVLERYKGSRPQPTITAIKTAIIKHFGISKTDLEGASKSRHHVYPRHIAMFMSRTLTGKSLPQIAFQFGKRDHTTVLSACRKIKARLKTDRSLSADIDAISNALQV